MPSGTSSRTYDVIVLGLGAMGSAAAYHLAGRGSRVLGLDGLTPPHDQGSSHGVSRVIRQAYYEDPAYVPLILRAYELWEELEQEYGRQLLFKTGGLMIGPPEGELVRGSTASASHHNLPYELLTAAEVRRRYPVLTPAPGTVALYEAAAGYVLAEETIRAHLAGAQARGAVLQFEEPVRHWEVTGSGTVVVTTPRGVYEAGALVVSAGPWAPQVLGTRLPLQVTRQVLYWLDPQGGAEPFRPEAFPIFAWQFTDNDVFYGFPALEGPQGGVKIAFHTAGEECTPATIRRTVEEDEVDALRDALAGRIPALAEGRLLQTAACMYTNTPDGHFVLAPHPQYPQVILATGFSGHGFKFATVVGEITADLALTGATAHPVALFSPQRFG